MKYEVQLTARANKQFRKIDKVQQKRINIKLLALSDNPRPNGVKKLSVVDGYRIRVGDYRILYEISDKTIIILVLDIDHRKQVYRNL